MTVNEAINNRRSFRSLERINEPEFLVGELSRAASLSPSCFNNQPWRYIFIYNPEILQSIYQTLSKGNEWALKSNLIIAVFSRKENDCLIQGREYYWFDTGMSVGFLMLKAWELGVVAHPIAGFDEQKAKGILAIPSEYQLLTLLILGRHSEKISSILNERQQEGEKARPARLTLEQFVFHNQFKSA